MITSNIPAANVAALQAALQPVGGEGD